MSLASSSDGKSQGAPGLIRGLDGLRAVSVLAVMLYHAHFEWMRGGFLGVEVFFVLSGFLITGLLVKEHAAKGRIDLVQFWRRRLRRLLPALLAFLLVVSTIGVLFLGTQASQFRADLAASLLYVENWQQIRSGSSYFADQGLPLLRHLWSLAIEGQFYLLWPFAVAGLVHVAKGRLWPLVATTVLLAAASFGLMLGLADPGNLSAVKALDSLNRVYLGTDTRALGLLAGALLALVLHRRELSRTLVRVLDLGSVLALAALAVLLVRVDAQEAFLYRGGFLLVDALTLVVVAALALPSAGKVRSLLGVRPLEWLGERSYGLYLWHWPVFRLLAPREDGVLWFLARLAVTLALTEVSYRYLEGPVKRGALKGLFTQMTWSPLRVAGVLLLLGAAGETVILVNRAPYVDLVAEAIQAGAAALDNQPPLATVPAPPVPAPPRPGPAGPARAGTRVAATVIPMPEAMKGLHLTAIGDSVMKGAALPLRKLGEASLGSGMIQINAEECRPFASALQVLRTYKAEERLGEMVVIHLGTNNSSISEDLFRRLMKLLEDRTLVLFLTARSDKTKACEAVNKTLLALAAGYPNARVLDWNVAAEAHPEYFYSDLTHLRPEGAQYYAELILTQLALPIKGAPESAPLPKLAAQSASGHPAR